MVGKISISEKILDDLTEMMNIGAGNAATALNQLTQREIIIDIPKVQIRPSTKLPLIKRISSSPVFCSKMNMVGEITGVIFFLVLDKKKMALIELLEESKKGFGENGEEADFSALTEVANIVTGVYLTTLGRFCGLNIYHTVPTYASDMFQSLLDETLSCASEKFEKIIEIENYFLVKEEQIETYLFIMPSGDSWEKLHGAIEKARDLLRN